MRSEMSASFFVGEVGKLVDNKAVKAYRERRGDRLKARGVRLDAADFKDGKFTSGSGSNDAGKKQEGREQKKTEASVPVRKVKDAGAYVKKLSAAKKSLPAAAGPWRVSAYNDGEHFAEEHPGAKMYSTDGGSTIAVTSDGDIVGVCHHAEDKGSRGKDLLEFAVKNGGKKLDAYQGLFGFYTKCGFEPVSWCEWDEQWAPDDWKKGRDDAEHIIFYKYTGKKSKYSNAAEFLKAVKPSADYGAAKDVRDSEV